MKYDKTITEAMERFKMAEEYESSSREEMLDDIKFANLDQWPAKLKAMRETDVNGARPCLVLDKIGQYRRQIINDARQNLPSIRVRPVDDKGDKDTAEVINGILRHIQDVSSADIAYLTALEWSVTCGLGYFRILTEYQTNDSWSQDIAFARVHNGPFGVYFDPHSTVPDGSDAEWCFLPTEVPKDLFKQLYPKAETMDFAGEYIKSSNDWFSEDTVRMAEYFFIKREKDDVLLLADQSSIYGSRYQKLMEDGADVPPVTKTRSVERRVCMWQKITGSEVLEETEFPSSYIPVIPVIGTEFWIDGKRSLSGIVRPAKDPQRAYNYWAAVATEVSALTPRAPFIGAAGQFEGYENKWRDANIENQAYLEYNPVALDGTLSPPPQRQPFPGPPTGMLAMMQVFEGNIQTALGLYQASVGAPSNEKSGIAIRERKNEGDVGTLHYRGNLALSMRHGYRIILEMIPRILDTAQIARIIGEDGTVDTIALDPNMQEPTVETPKGQPNIHNITIGRYDVSVDIGPAYATRRQEAAQSMIEIIQANPAMMQIAGDIMMRNMDWPGADQLADRLKKSLPPNLADPEDGEEEIPPQVQQQMDQMGQQAQEGQQMIQSLQQQLQEASQAAQEGQMAAKDKEGELQIKGRELEIKAFEAQTKRMETEAKLASETVEDPEESAIRAFESETKRIELKTKRMELEIKAHEVGARAEQVGAETRQTEDSNEVLAALVRAQHGIEATLAEISQAAPPKSIELTRDADGRASGALVHQSGKPSRQVDLTRDNEGRIEGAE